MQYEVGNPSGFTCPCCNQQHAYLAVLTLDQAEVAEHLAEGCVLRHKFDPATMNTAGTMTPEEAEEYFHNMMNPS
jgi:hypothetical protein